MMAGRYDVGQDHDQRDIAASAISPAALAPRPTSCRTPPPARLGTTTSSAAGSTGAPAFPAVPEDSRIRSQFRDGHGRQAASGRPRPERHAAQHRLRGAGEVCRWFLARRDLRTVQPRCTAPSQVARATFSTCVDKHPDRVLTPSQRDGAAGSAGQQEAADNDHGGSGAAVHAAGHSARSAVLQHRKRWLPSATRRRAGGLRKECSARSWSWSRLPQRLGSPGGDLLARRARRPAP